jgi:hypothetical protein
MRRYLPLLPLRVAAAQLLPSLRTSRTLPPLALSWTLTRTAIAIGFGHSYADPNGTVRVELAAFEAKVSIASVVDHASN